MNSELLIFHACYWWFENFWWSGLLLLESKFFLLTVCYMWYAFGLLSKVYRLWTDVTLINATQTCVCACVHVQELLLFIILLKKRKPSMYIFCYRKMRICVPLQMSCFVKVEVIHIIYYDKLGRSRTLLFVGWQFDLFSCYRYSFCKYM